MSFIVEGVADDGSLKILAIHSRWATAKRTLERLKEVGEANAYDEVLIRSA